MKILLLNGPNINLVGEREPDVYGKVDFNQIILRMQELARQNDVELTAHQSNHEGALIDWIQEAGKWADGLIINAGGLSHTSISIRDAIAASKLPTVEVHLSNVHARESFRHTLILSPIVIGVICGLGWRSYKFGLLALIDIIKERQELAEAATT